MQPVGPCGRIRPDVQTDGSILLVAILLLCGVGSWLRDPRDCSPALRAFRLVVELAHRALPQIIIAVSAQVVWLKEMLAIAAARDAGGAGVVLAHSGSLGLNFKVRLAKQFDCEVRVVFE